MCSYTGRYLLCVGCACRLFGNILCVIEFGFLVTAGGYDSGHYCIVIEGGFLVIADAFGTGNYCTVIEGGFLVTAGGLGTGNSRLDTVGSSWSRGYGTAGCPLGRRSGQS